MPDFADLPQLLTLKEACEVLRCSRSSVYRLINGGEILAFRPSKRKVLISANSIKCLFAHPFNKW
ncbi:helix-turn-helix domain-containing protein [Bifidobacterium sp. ESL0764]|uniref:helix-turn-helix domain-containing protein n=1 Tax=Bifidobacterium sp. ESL0764 TaxID=2983228 RepID=UPI0023F6EF71|nr:helix-turn-helix domain-containing protein [Bifidobacterium sp. ESL0764]WEV65484.1 helix-turn-helix domain-containing protein [Bifidobacterium sp. ESL0764]